MVDTLSTMNRAILPAVFAVVIALAGCGSSSSSSSSSSSAAAAPTPASSTPSSTPSAGGSVEVVIKNLAFVPATIHAKVGQTVRWINQDVPPHNVTYVSGPQFTSSGTMDTGATFQLKLTQAGTIQYFCSIHPFMKATIVVSP
jgi:plastocyanin